jgi:peroxiredoxin
LFSLENGQPAPEIDLVDTHGERWRLSDRRGQMVIVHACRGEF